jgi:hypothetical protein
MAENPKHESQPLTPEQMAKLETLLRETRDEAYAQGYSDGFAAGTTPRIEPEFGEQRSSIERTW